MEMAKRVSATVETASVAPGWGVDRLLGEEDEVLIIKAFWCL